MRVLVTGASGFVGKVLSRTLVQRGYSVCRAVRREMQIGHEQFALGSEAVVGEINAQTDWSSALNGVEVVIHLAARVHVMQERAADPLAAFRLVNVAGTERLAREAAARGVRRLVFASTIKVNGEETRGNRSYRESDPPAPQDPYGKSKYEAEQVLWQIAQETGLEVVIVRPPLVYGPGVKGNFIRMLIALAHGIPLPLASVRNQRSLIYIDNLVDALITCALHPAAAGQTYLISDGEDVSTPELLRFLAQYAGFRPRIIPFPVSLLKWLARQAGKGAQADRLLGSLRVESGKIRRELGWSPPVTLQQGLRATAEWYRTENL